MRFVRLRSRLTTNRSEIAEFCTGSFTQLPKFLGPEAHGCPPRSRQPCADSMGVWHRL